MIAHKNVQRAGVRILAARIRGNPVAPYDFGEEARTLGLSYSRFRKIFAEELHSPPVRYLTRLRMRWAADEMRRSGKKVAVVAGRIGMIDPYHFSRLFKRHMGLPPQAFRKRGQNSELKGQFEYART